MWTNAFAAFGVFQTVRRLMWANRKKNEATLHTSISHYYSTANRPDTEQERWMSAEIYEFNWLWMCLCAVCDGLMLIQW